MTTNQHTPGPWAFAHYSAGPTIYGSDNSAIARIEEWKGKWEETQESNARLIAAAPDLLAALKALTATARTFRNVPKDEQEWTPIDDEALNAAFAAIAKATGA